MMVSLSARAWPCGAALPFQVWPSVAVGIVDIRGRRVAAGRRVAWPQRSAWRLAPVRRSWRLAPRRRSWCPAAAAAVLASCADAASLASGGSEALSASDAAEALPASWLDAAVLASTNGSADFAPAVAEPPITVSGAAAAAAAGGVVDDRIGDNRPPQRAGLDVGRRGGGAGVGAAATAVLIVVVRCGFGRGIRCRGIGRCVSDESSPLSRQKRRAPCRAGGAGRCGRAGLIGRRVLGRGLDLPLRLSLRRDWSAQSRRRRWPARRVRRACAPGRRRSRHCCGGRRISPRADRSPWTRGGRPVAAPAADWWCPGRLRRRRPRPQRGRHHCPGRCLGSPPASAAMAKARLRAWH